MTPATGTFNWGQPSGRGTGQLDQRQGHYEQAPGRPARPARWRQVVTAHGARFTRFSVIGGGIFLAGLAFQAGLTSGFRVPAFLSYIVQTVVSVEVSFLLNRWITWRGRGTAFWLSFWRYNAQKAITVAVNLLLYAALLRLGMNYIVANVSLTAVFTVVNYIGGDCFVFAADDQCVRASVSMTGSRLSRPRHVAAASEIPVSGQLSQGTD